MNKYIKKIGFNGRPFIQNQMRGIARHTFNLINELHILEPEIEIHIFCNDKMNIHFKEKLLFATFHENKIKPKFLWEVWYLPKLLKSQSIDLYHSTNNVGIPYTNKIPTILTIHDVITHQHRITFKFSNWWGALNYKLEYALLKKANQYLTVSQDSKLKINSEMNIDKNKIEVYYNGTNLTNTSEEEDKGNYYLYVGGLEERKNVEFLIDTLSELSCDFSGLKLILVSEVESANLRLKDKIQKSNFSIEIKSRLTDEELGGLYSKAKMVIIPSLDEGFGLPVAEAMGLRSPLAISRIPIFLEVSNLLSYFFSPHDNRELKRIIEHVESLELDLDLYTEKAFTYSQKYSWRQMAIGTIDTYLNVFKKYHDEK